MSLHQGRIGVDTRDGLERYGFADFNPCGRTNVEYLNAWPVVVKRCR